MIRGLRNNRPGMVESCDQYEFCYRVLEESLWGEVAKSITTSESNKKPAAEKKSKFKLFGRKRYPIIDCDLYYSPYQEMTSSMAHMIQLFV